MKLVNLEPDDWQRYSAIRLRALQTDPEAFFSTAEESLKFSEKDWRRRLAIEDSRTIVASDDAGQDVGLVAALPYTQSDGEPGDYELVAMWVAPEARRAGLSKELVRATIDASREFGAKRLVLWVAWGNLKAELLYERFGFKRTGETGKFPPPRETPEFKMALKLNKTRPPEN